MLNIEKIDKFLSENFSNEVHMKRIKKGELPKQKQKK